MAEQLVQFYQKIQPLKREAAVFKVFLLLEKERRILGPIFSHIAWDAYVPYLPDRFIGALKLQLGKSAAHYVAQNKDFCWDVSYLISQFNQEWLRTPSDDLLTFVSYQLYG